MVINLHEFYEMAKKQIGRDALYLTEFAFGINRTSIIAGKEIEVTYEALEKAKQLLQRRADGEPLQYIAGGWEFFGLNFKVGKGVLIPRADTEILVETAISVCNEKPVIADLCSGSGCIAISIKKSVPNAEIYAYELFDEAINYLFANAKMNDADINIIKADVTKKPEKSKFDIIVSNPPYLTSVDMSKLQREVTFEPQTALYGGDDGLEFYRKITECWADTLNDGGYLIYEIGINEEKAVTEIMQNNGFSEIEQIKDLSGIIRVIKGKRRKN